MTDGKGNTEKLLSSLGLCAKAGKLIFGVPMICEALKSKKASVTVVLEASDTSENTHKRITDKCNFYNARLVRINCTGEKLASAVGKSSFIGAVAVVDANLSLLVEKYI